MEIKGPAQFGEPFQTLPFPLDVRQGAVDAAGKGRACRKEPPPTYTPTFEPHTAQRDATKARWNIHTLARARTLRQTDREKTSAFAFKLLISMIE